MCVLVRRDTIMCRKFQDLMRNGDNKTELFLMIANAIRKIENVSTSIIATAGDKVISNGFDVYFSNIVPCNHEEADTRLILNVFDGIKKGYKKITIVTVDTDVVIIDLYHFYDLNIEELWIEYGTRQHKRWLQLHNYANTLGEETFRALPIWFTTLAAIQCLSLVVVVRRQHGMFGVYLRKQHQVLSGKFSNLI